MTIKMHGEYPFEGNTGWTKLMKIDAEIASAIYNRNMAVIGSSGLVSYEFDNQFLNKGYRIIYENNRSNQYIALYKHDAMYYLIAHDKKAFDELWDKRIVLKGQVKETLKEYAVFIDETDDVCIAKRY